MSAIVILDQAALALARRIGEAIGDAEVHGLAGRVVGADRSFTGTAAHLGALFEGGEDIIGVMAAGILIRALAPRLADKGSEPAVVAVAADASAVVPLLGGHGGANALARTIAAAIGGRAAVTTASDLMFGCALDAPPPGWRIDNREAAKDLQARMLAGERIAVAHECGDAAWLRGAEGVLDFAAAGSGAGMVRISARIDAGGERDLMLHPPVLALGMGCERGAAPDEVIALAEKTLAEAGLSPLSLACVVSIDLKMDEEAVHALARHFAVPARFFTAAELEAETPRLVHPSNAVFAEVGCHGVAEGAALAAAGPGGTLAMAKRKSKRATCAVGLAPGGIDAARTGIARGRLTVVGIGPGQDGWRTPEATRALLQADAAVGYALYLDLVSDLLAGTARFDSELAEEEARVRKALDLAAEGRSVALVCSGDAGIYALATLTFELLDREDRAEWNRIDISVAPGVSAFQAAAARIGAPMGHDFCTVSLSDLLTPWPQIERRLKAAAAGDFVVAFYNPVSRRRRTQLEAARDILLSGRSPETPVVLARNLGRDGESVRVITLGELTADCADMLTMVVVGNSETRRIERGGRAWIYTPRGYAAKIEGKMGDTP